MTIATESPGILLVDDGELDGVARVFDEQGTPYTRLRGGQIPDQVAPPSNLLIVTPRRVERVRRGSPADAAPGRPLRIIAVGEDSPAMRRRLRRNGLHLLIRLPAEPEIWRLLVARALYRGSERRADPRVAVGSPVELPQGAASRTLLVDLSNRGCRLQTNAPLSIGDPVSFTIPEDGQAWCEGGPLTLHGRVRRLVSEPDDSERRVAIVFDPDLPEHDRTRLTALINHWASGPHSLDAAAWKSAPPIPPCRLPSLPELTLDDETDPPIAAASETRVALAESTPDSGAERREHDRAVFETPVTAQGEQGPFVLIGRDLSAGGMRIERHPDLTLGDRLEIALHGPAPSEPIRVEAEVTRDDGANGLGLAFRSVVDGDLESLEKMVACLPDVESLEDGELAGMGAILSEIIAAPAREA